MACVLPLLCGCTSISVAGGSGLDLGTLAVSGTQSGVGAQVEALGWTRSGAVAYGAGMGVQIAGYSSDGDGDPIALTTLEARYRRDLGTRRSRGPYGELGAGLGGAWAPTLQRLAVPLHGEVGYRAGSGRTRLSVGLRERLIPMVGTGSPPFDVLNSLQLLAGLAVKVGGS